MWVACGHGARPPRRCGRCRSGGRARSSRPGRRRPRRRRGCARHRWRPGGHRAGGTARQRSQTCWMRGLPAIGWRGLPGKRVDPQRAGRIPMMWSARFWTHRQRAGRGERRFNSRVKRWTYAGQRSKVPLIRSPIRARRAPCRSRRRRGSAQARRQDSAWPACQARSRRRPRRGRRAGRRDRGRASRGRR